MQKLTAAFVKQAKHRDKAFSIVDGDDLQNVNWTRVYFKK
jgi:hypothetical protein